MTFDDLLARAAEPSLSALIGTSQMKLLSRLDPQLTYPDRLRDLLLELRPASDLLLQPTSRAELLELLPPREAERLAARLGLTSDGSAFDALRAVEIRRGSRLARELFEFFDVPLPEPPAKEPVVEATNVSPTYSLFPHQRRAANETYAQLTSGDRRVLLHMPTGAGKTRTAMHLIARFLREGEPRVVVWLAHSEELCQQAFDEFEKAWRSLGDRPVGAHRWWGHHDFDVSNVRDGLVVAGLAKAYAEARRSTEQIGRLGSRAELVVMDEAHQAVADTYSFLLNFLTNVGTRDTSLLGLTATPGRSWSDVEEDERLSDFFGRNKVTLRVDGYASPVSYLVEEGYLAAPVYESLNYSGGPELTPRDLSELSRTLEIPARVLASLAEDEQRNLQIVNETRALIRRHSRVIVFAATVAHAELLAVVLQAVGVDADVVTGGTSKEERARRIARFKEGSSEPRVLVNYGVLTTGFDAPQTSAALIARPTLSLVLYSQMVGRATRGTKAGGNKHAEIVTVVDTALPGFADLTEAFENWEDVWKQAAA